ILCISASWSLPKPFSAKASNSLLRVSGALQMARSSASFLKNSGNLPNSNSMNCCADMGVPSGCQKLVHIMCWIVRDLPSASLILIVLGRGAGSYDVADGSDMPGGGLGFFGVGSSG